MATAIRKPRKHKPAHDRNGIVVNDQVSIPHWVSDLDSFRKWCVSGEYPEHADVFWLGGLIWIGVAAEDLPTHNAVKQELSRCLDNLVRELKSGMIVSDRMRLVNEGAGLSVEPDLMFVSIESVRTGRVKIQANEDGRVLEVRGSPDVVVEVASDSSEQKDARLAELYFAAGVREYWRIDARPATIKFEILRRGSTGFVAVLRRHGRLRSSVFARSFALRVAAGPIGMPLYSLDVSSH